MIRLQNSIKLICLWPVFFIITFIEESLVIVFQFLILPVVKATSFCFHYDKGFRSPSLFATIRVWFEDMVWFEECRLGLAQFSSVAWEK